MNTQISSPKSARVTTQTVPSARRRASAVGGWKLIILWCLELGAWSFVASAQPDPTRNRTTTHIGTNRVSITVTGGERVIQANGLPDHAPGQFPNRGNPNSISEQTYNFRV